MWHIMSQVAGYAILQVETTKKSVEIMEDKPPNLQFFFLIDCKV
jgi:hypothetical protein